MIKKYLIFIIISSCLVFTSGCFTIIDTLKGAAQGAAEGIKKDWGLAEESDAWMRENLW